MQISLREQDIRIDTGKSENGTFVRVCHTPSGVVCEINPIGTRKISDVVSELTDDVSNAVEKLPAPFTLWRLDDNDNEFQMLGFWSLSQAVKVKEEYEAKGHKQTYWVSKHDAKQIDAAGG